jgi:transcriptional regulator with XRE-family HTH domain
MAQLKEIAVVIKMHRKAAGLSRIRLAELAGVGKSAIYDIEHGKESVQLDTLQKILNVLNIKIVLKSPLLENIQNTENAKS